MGPMTDGRAPGELVASLAAANAVAGPILDAQYVAVQVTGTFVATVVFEQSNDNVNWVPCLLQPVALQSTAMAASFAKTSGAANDAFAGAVPAEFFRVRMSARTSGTADVRVAAYSQPILDGPRAPQGVRAQSDAYTPGAAQDTLGLNLAMNLAGTWDRLRMGRARTAANLQGGLGVDHGTAPLTTLAAVTTAVAGTALDLGSVKAVHAVQVTGGGATWAVILEGSMDGATWFPLGTIDNTNATGGYLAVADRPVSYLRARSTAAPAAALTARIASV
jgi:hypothetical protein